MKKLLFILCTFLSVTATAQTVRLDKSSKCDAATQAIMLNKAVNPTYAPTQVQPGNAIPMLAKVTPTFDAEALTAQGIVVGSRAGDIVTLRVPADKVDILDHCPDILIYSVARPIQPLMDRVRYDTRTDSVYEGIGLPQSYTGDGVLIGITDWGFDYKHINYNNKGSDNHRILRAWDQFKLSGPAPAGFDYGTEHVGRTALLAAECDTFGLYGYGTHGTHVAGIAAGRGIDGHYRGQAPNAQLLMASFYLNEAAWIDAVNWMKNVAREEGKRLVVNCSWGMYTLGPIDGTSLVSQALNNFSDSGIVFCVSAGNNGNDKFHVSQTFTEGQHDTLCTIAEYYGSQETGSALTLWGEPGKSFEATIAFERVADKSLTYYQWLNTADGTRLVNDYVLAGNDTLPFTAAIDQSHPCNQRPAMLITVPKNRNFRTHLFITAPEGTVHAWNLCTLENGAGNMGAKFVRDTFMRYTPGDDEYGVAEPACAENCIAVAAAGNDRENNLAFLASFSSHGPIIDGRHKPDLSAPGTQIVSSVSSFTTDGYTAVYSKLYAGRTYSWARMSGTSMSCPATTGIVALLLEANPDLTPNQVKDILTSTTRNDERTGPLHERDSISNVWGWGKVDAYAAINKALSMVSIDRADTSWFAHSLQVYPNPARTSVTVLTGRDSRETVALYAVDGRLVDSHEAILQTTFDLSRLPRGIYFVRCGARNAKVVVE